MCDHIVCLLDLLGQKHHLTDWSVMPLDDVLTDSMKDAIYKTADIIWHYRHQLTHYANEFNKPTIPKELISTLPVEQQDFYYRVRDTRLRTQQFSDTFLVYAPLQTSKRERTVLPVFGVLFGCCLTMLQSLASGIPVRGGIDVGVGIELSESNFYGPSLATAHYLENKIARYPRIVVCENAVSMLDAIIDGTSHFIGQDELLNEISRRAAEDCRALLTQDDDEEWIIDYLGPHVSEVFKRLPIEPLEMNTLRMSAHAFAQKELARFQQLADETHAARYSRLCAYFVRRGLE
ncbi:MAG: hypothetical protein NCW75_11665 [Phycisphaera sp.]|nr:MAG: hypothetical protein NCW75_11665 [Phycisphaera sp.]